MPSFWYPAPGQRQVQGVASLAGLDTEMGYTRAVSFVACRVRGRRAVEAGQRRVLSTGCGCGVSLPHSLLSLSPSLLPSPSPLPLPLPRSLPLGATDPPLLRGGGGPPGRDTVEASWRRPGRLEPPAAQLPRCRAVSDLCGAGWAVSEPCRCPQSLVTGKGTDRAALAVSLPLSLVLHARLSTRLRPSADA